MSNFVYNFSSHLIASHTQSCIWSRISSHILSHVKSLLQISAGVIFLLISLILFHIPYFSKVIVSWYIWFYFIIYTSHSLSNYLRSSSHSISCLVYLISSFFSHVWFLSPILSNLISVYYLIPYFSHITFVFNLSSCVVFNPISYNVLSHILFLIYCLLSYCLVSCLISNPYIFLYPILYLISHLHHV